MGDFKNDTTTDRDNSYTNSKVGQIIEDYNLDGQGAWLEAAWTGDGIERLSLRELADEFNQRVLEAAMVETGMNPLQKDITNTYEILTDEETSSGDRVEVRNRLKWNGIDVDALESDFVTHQAIHTYLRKYRGVEQTESDTDPREKERETIERLQGRTKAVTTNSLERLATQDELDLDSFDVLVNVQVICGECGTQYQIADLFEAGGCDCR